MIEGSHNIGDWSEFYTLLRILASRKIYIADENLNKIEDSYVLVNRVLRDENSNVQKRRYHMDYVFAENGIMRVVEAYKDNSLCRIKTMEEMSSEADSLLNALTAKDENGFACGEKFLNDLELVRLAASSSEVTDIRVEVIDTVTSRKQQMGFSIKSYLGGAPTLLNASEATNFIYRINGLTWTQAQQINAISTKQKILDRIKQIIELGGSFSFVKTNNSVFSDNLMMIDSLMPEIVAEAVLYSYLSNTDDCNKVISYLEETDPLGVRIKQFYRYKFKKFLCAKALGMDPSKRWAGIDEANGGYIAVKSDGTVLAYHLYNRDMFEKYLLDNTNFERASTGKHNYAKIYQEDGELFIKFNLQIRFKKNH